MVHDSLEMPSNNPKYKSKIKLKMAIENLKELSDFEQRETV